MAWLTNTKTGKPFNTEWLDADERKKYAQIEKNQAEGEKLNKEEKTKKNTKGSHKAFGYSYNTSDRIKVADLEKLGSYTELSYDYYNIENKNVLEIRGLSSQPIPNNLLDRVYKADNDGNPWGYYTAVTSRSKNGKPYRVYIPGTADVEVVRKIVKEIENKYGSENIIVRKKGIPYLVKE